MDEAMGMSVAEAVGHLGMDRVRPVMQRQSRDAIMRALACERTYDERTRLAWARLLAQGFTSERSFDTTLES